MTFLQRFRLPLKTPQNTIELQLVLLQILSVFLKCRIVLPLAKITALIRMILRKSKTIIIPSYTSSNKHRTMYAISKINKQHEQTWVALQKRLNSVQFNFETIFANQETYNFIRNKAISVGSCDGYLIPTLLTTTAYVLAQKGTRIETSTHKQPINLYTLFIGYPGTGKFCNLLIYNNTLTMNYAI